MRKFFHVILLSAFFYLLHGLRADIQLPSFSAESIRRHWQTRADVQFQSQHSFPDNVPEVCGKLLLPKAKEGAADYPYPGIALDLPRAGSGLRDDWGNVKRISLVVFSDREDKLRVLIWNRLGQRSSFDIALKKGRNVIDQEFSLELDLSAVKTIYFYKRLPPADWTLHLGQIRLVEENSEILVRRKEKLKKEFVALKGDFSELPEEMRKEASDSILKGEELLENPEPANWQQLQKVVRDLTVFQQENSFRKDFLRGGVALGFVSCMEKVRREKHFFLSPPQATAFLDAARGEGEGIQITALADTDLASVSLRVGEFVSEDGDDRIPASAISLFPVAFVDCQTSTYYVNNEPPGWWPDPILSSTSQLPLTKGKYQSWYLDIQIPSGQKPAIYAGQVYFSGEGLAERCLSLKLKVRKFSLPAGTPYLFAASLQVDHDGSLFRTFSEADKKLWRRQLSDLFLSHRVNPTELYSPPQPVEDHQYKLNKGAESFNIMYLTGESRERSMRQILAKLTPAIDELKEKNIYAKAYLYGFDEWNKGRLQDIEDICSEIKGLYPDLPIMTTANDPDFGVNSILKSVDIYCPTMPEYERNWEKIKTARAAGKKIMWYTAIGIGAPYPNFYIEYPQMDPRLMMGLMFWKYRPDGFLYWALGRFFQNVKVDGKWQRQVGTLPAEETLFPWTPNTFCDANGEGMLVYPSVNGPLPTLRLKAVRDGLEDYMYLKKLSDALEQVKQGLKIMPASWVAASEKELEIEQELVNTLSDYTKKPEFLFAKRQRMADLLDQAEQ